MLKAEMEQVVKSKSRTFLSFCFCFILGIAVFSSNFSEFDWQLNLYILLFFIIFWLFVFWSNLIKRFVGICCLFFVIGGLRFFWSVPSLQENKLHYYNNHMTTMVGKVSQEVVVKENNSQAVISVSSVGDKEVSGKALLFLPLYSDLKFGDFVLVECQLKKPVGSENFINYDKYLARDGIWSQCSWPKIHKLAHLPSWLEKIQIYFFNFKKSVQVQVERLWVEPESSLMAGLLYGARAGFTTEVKSDFNRAGITHIVAISGYNISIVANVMMWLLLVFGLNRRVAFWWAMVGIIIFVLFTGTSASVVRAGIMGVIVLLALQMGRLSRVGNILVFTAAIMLLFNPFDLVWDAGFQLSFLSTLGLVYLSPLLNSYFSIDNKKVVLKSLVENFIMTISAIIATFPLILFQFGRLSLVAPLANLLIVWVVPYLMLVGFIAIILSVVFFPLAWAVAWVAHLGLNYVIIMARTFASWPMASINLSVSLWVMIVMYGLIMFYIYKYAKN